jgi:hypothetical protein
LGTCFNCGHPSAAVLYFPFLLTSLTSNPRGGGEGVGGEGGWFEKEGVFLCSQAGAPK